MLNDYRKILLCALLLLFVAAQSINAQFYKQQDSIARIIKEGNNRKPSTISGTSRANIQKSKKKKSSKKSSAEGRAAKSKTKKTKKDTTKVVKPKRVAYSGYRYRLGERVIMRGDSGNDVKAIANILVKKLFLEEKDIIHTADGGVLYDGEIVRAIKLFQKVSGIYDDGIVGKPTLKALRRRK